VILGDDKAGPAFAQFTRQVERANNSVDRNNAALKRQGATSAKARQENDKLGKSFDKLAKATGPSALGIGIALSPGLIPLTAGLAAGVAAVGTSFGAALAGAGLFAAMAKTAITSAGTDAKKLGQLQAQLAKADQARQQATTKAGRQAAAARAAAIRDQIAQLKAQEGTAARLVTLTTSIKNQWVGMSRAVAGPALVPWLDAVNRGMKYLKPLVQPVADLFKMWGQTVDRYFTSARGSAEIGRLAGAVGRFSALQLSEIVAFFVNVAKAVGNLGRDLAQHNVDFNNFGNHLNTWGSAFLAWSQSANARKDVGQFLAWFRTNGKTVSDLLGSLGQIMPTLFGGLSAAGQLELKLISGFLGFVAKLPPSFSKPLLDIAGAMLLLSKTGVLPIGLKIIGVAAGTGAGGAAGGGGAAEGAAGGGLAGMLSKSTALKWGVRAGLLYAGVVLVLQGTTSGPGGKNWFENPFGMPGPKDPKSANNWLTSWSPYFNRFKQNIDGIVNAWNVAWNAIVKSADIAKNEILIGWDYIQLSALHTVQFILSTFGKLPGPLGEPFRIAAKGISNSMAGVQADIANRTQQIQNDIDSIHGKSVTVDVNARGAGKIAFSSLVPGSAVGQPQQVGVLTFHAAGGRVTGGIPGRDSVPGMLMPGEVIVPTAMVRAGAVDHLRGRLPGFAAGGQVTGIYPPAGVQTAPDRVGIKESDWGQQAAATFTRNVVKTAQKMLAAGSGPAVLAFAETFKGTPYVWGGSTPSGWDCSGFVSWIYDHFGLFAGRTDAAGLQRWAKPSSPTPGGLAFYGYPAHHVGFVVNGSTLLSALGRQYGTIESSLFMGDNSGYGVPPRGFGTKALPPGGATPQGKIQELAFSLVSQYGWPGQWGAFSALEMAEAGWNMTAVNPSSGAYGLAQFINGPSEYFQYGGDPNTALGQLTAMMNYIASRWGSPNAAWANEAAHHWYDAGGWLPPGASVAYNGTGRPERVLPPGADAGGVTYNINVQVAPGASPADTGRAIVRAIREFERSSGTGWRR
jgi:cell wall-associated NlpC family hydrolase